MNDRLIQLRFVVALLLLGWMVRASQAAVTFLGPSPYLSRADSPFPVDGSNPNFFLEDFEDGKLNTTGIYQPLHPVFGTAFQGEVMGPSDTTDSVDADDGPIDGSGAAGHSFRSRVDFITSTIPPGHNIHVDFEFDEATLGFLPHAFGFVWTDGAFGSFNSLQLTTRTGLAFVSPIVVLGDDRRDGTTEDDRFIGVVSSEGILSVRISSSFHSESDLTDYFEIDHVQYGFVVPEPSIAVLMVSAVAWGMSRKWRFGRYN
jgi:hypothetical protein